tara:strand:+ start:785 stop:970 length:186 start_codon:yes stop_codon:yes gene_type:complete
MFTAIAIVCSLESGGCFSVANEAIFLTLKDCQDNAYTAQAYAEVNNLELVRLACYDWGVET